MVNINVGVQGTGGLVALQQQLRDVHTSLNAINSIQRPAEHGINAVAGSVVSPIAGLSSGRQEMMDYNREILDHSRNIRALTNDYNNFETVISRAATQVGRLGREYEQVRNSFSFAGMANSMTMASATSDWARGTGINYQQVASSQRSMMESGALTSQDYNKLIEAVSEGTIKGSTQSYAMQNDRMMAMVSSTANAQAARSGSSNVGAIGAIYAAFGQTGNPLLRAESGQAAFQRADNNFATTRDPFSEQMAFQAMRQVNPGMDYFQFQMERGKGLDSIDKIKALTGEYTRTFGNKNQRAYEFAQGGFAGNSLQAQALFDVVDKGYLNGSDPAAAKMLDPFNQTGAGLGLLPLAANAAYGEFGKGNSFDIQGASIAYKKQTGQDFDTKKYGSTQEGFVKGLSDFKGQLKGEFSDRTDYAQADIGNTYLEASQNFKNAIESVNSMSVHIADWTKALTDAYGQSGVSKVGVGPIAVGQGVLGGIFGAVGHALTATAIGRVLGIGGTSAATTAATTTATTATTATGATGLTLGGVLAPVAGVAGGMLAGGLLGGLAGGAMDRMGGGEGRKGWALPLLGVAGGIVSPALLATLGIGGGRWLANNGPLKGTGAGNAMNSVDDWMHNVPGFTGIFGQRTGYGKSTSGASAEVNGNTDTGTILVDVNAEQLKVLQSIDRKLDGPTGQVATDNAYQSRYSTNGRGGPGSITNVTNMPSTTGGLTTQSDGSTTPGVPGAGFGAPSAQALQAVLDQKSKQNGKQSPFTGEMIAQMSAKYGVPATLIMGLLNKESQFGTDNGSLNQYNNFGGITGTEEQVAAGQTVQVPGGGGRNFLKFDSPQAFLEYKYKFLLNSKYYNGTSLEELIGNYFAGPQAWAANGTAAGDGNPANGNVQDYVNQVLDMIEKLTGKRPSQKDIPIGRGSTPSGGKSLIGNNPIITELPNGTFSHNGLNAVDIAGGGSIYAPMGGKVTAMSNGIAGTTGGTGLGNNITIMGADGVSYTIGHLAGGGMQGLGVGTDIARGQLIGEMGSTGNSTGVHAHVQLNNRTIEQQNALAWLIKNGGIPSNSPRNLDGSGGVGGPGGEDDPLDGKMRFDSDGGSGWSSSGATLNFAPLEVLVKNESGALIDRQFLPMTLDTGYTRANQGQRMFGKEQVR